MKSLTIILLFLSTCLPAQEFLPIQAKTNVGEVSLNANYIHFSNRSVQRIKLVHTNLCCVDLYAWSWVLRDTEYHFERSMGETFLLRTNLKSGDVIQFYKVMEYRYETTK